MSGRMNWRRAALHGRPTLDKRYEFDTPDRAARWLKTVERQRAEARQRARAPSVSRSADWIRALSTAEVPW